MYWQIGRIIFEEEQQGAERAGYGEFLIKSLADSLEPQFGTGFSSRQLNLFRQFYRVFPIVNALRSLFSWTQSDVKEIIKEPMILEFLGLKREAAYYEKDLEKAIITHL